MICISVAWLVGIPFTLLLFGLTVYIIELAVKALFIKYGEPLSDEARVRVTNDIPELRED